MLQPVFHRQDLIVVDDFYDNPEDVRSFALTCEYKKPLISSTPGLISNKRHPETKKNLDKISRIVECNPNWDLIENVHEFWGQSGCGEFQLSLGHLTKMGQVHSHKNGQWVGIVYLSAPRDSDGKNGTLIVSHKESKLNHFDQISLEEYNKLTSDARDPSKWDIVFTPEMRFNRLFIFDSRLFHAESPGFGTEVVNGRLIQISNFNSV